MRSGEFTSLSMEEFTPDMLTLQDMAVDSHTSPSHVVIHLKRSKMIPCKRARGYYWTFSMSRVLLDGTWLFVQLSQGLFLSLVMAHPSLDLDGRSHYARFSRKLGWTVLATAGTVSELVRDNSSKIGCE